MNELLTRITALSRFVASLCRCFVADSVGGTRKGGTSLPVISVFVVVTLLIGCQSNEPVADDEFLVAARRRNDNRTPEQIADDFDSTKDEYNYFKEMDRIALQQQSEENDFPDQLLDTLDGKPRPKRTVGAPSLNASEILGRNTWMLWCAGNDRFWDWLANHSLGLTDLVKLLDTRGRATRFDTAGLINQPAMRQAACVPAEQFGIWLDEPVDASERGWRTKYLEGAFERIARDEPLDSTQKGCDPKSSSVETCRPVGVPRPELYGLSSGIIGLRLFPNPEFKGAARKNWNAAKYYSVPSYYNDRHLVRPFRVGMTCAFCHASFHPLNPPRDIANPEWANLSGNTGAQYLRIRGVFGNLLTDDNFVYHLLDSEPPGTVDTSLIATDNINNPNTMNAIFGVPARVALSFKNPHEKLSTAGQAQPSLWGSTDPSRPDYYPYDSVPSEYRKFFEGLGLGSELTRSNDNPRRVPRILLDGSDSIGAWGALARVYLNIGAYSERWNQLHNPLVGFRPQQPFLISDCETHSPYWHATQRRVGPMRDYFLRVTNPMRLLDAEGAADKADRDIKFSKLNPRQRARRINVKRLKSGRLAFAKNCIVCHSSKQPDSWFAEMSKRAEQGEFWLSDPAHWLQDPQYSAWATKAVETVDFWKGNYLSNDYRIPITIVGTNAGRALGTNAITGNMWQDFSSASYRSFASVGGIPFFDPYEGAHGADSMFSPRHAAPEGVPPGGGGPGFYRVPTLISIWATAPLLHNNSLGQFNNDPSTDGRLAAFDDAIRKLLWPEQRLESSSYNGATAERLKQDHGLIWRLPKKAWLTVPAADVPELLAQAPLLMRVRATLATWFTWDVHYLWLPPTAFLIVGFVILWFSRRRWVRIVAYLAVIVPGLLLGFALYLVQGRLGDVRIGPIPEGTPVNLLANLNPDADKDQFRNALTTTIDTLSEIESRKLDANDAQKLLKTKIAPALMAVSKCPDFVMDHGHNYPWFATMTDDDKEGLIELLKTF